MNSSLNSITYYSCYYIANHDIIRACSDLSALYAVKSWLTLKKNRALYLK